jgi:hypothetical protein
VRLKKYSVFDIVEVPMAKLYSQTFDVLNKPWSYHGKHLDEMFVSTLWNFTYIFIPGPNQRDQIFLTFIF